MTRRIIRPQPKTVEDMFTRPYKQDPNSVIIKWIGEGRGQGRNKCPYGQPGDILWVRETWAYQFGLYWHKAGPFPVGSIPPEKWRPSIYMPREAARLFLRVKSIQVEQLQDITEADVIAEGTKDGDKYIEKWPSTGDEDTDTSIRAWHISCFEQFWNEINYKRGYGWYINPWVWVIEFEKVIS